MVARISIAGVSERDIDLLVLEEFQSSPSFVTWFQDAIEAKFGIPIIYTSTLQDLATERAASWLSKHFTYWWLEQQGHGRVLIDSDQL